MATHQSGNSLENHRDQRMCKVRFEGSPCGGQQQQQPKRESPRSKWRRFGRLSLLRQGRMDKAQPMQMQQMPPTIVGGGGVNTSEEESSSNSTPNLTEHRLSMQTEMMAAAARSASQQTAGGTNSYMAMQHSSSASTSPAGQGNDDKRSKKGRDRESRGKSCLFGAFHVETGARLFLLFYIFLSACGVAFGSVATMVWILVPLVVIPMAAYSLSKNASKYLYPFLIISIIHSLVALLMVLIVGSFSLLCFDQLKAHFAESMAAFPSGQFPSSSFTALCCALTMALSLGLALFFFWQSLVLFSCINHFDVMAQQKRQQQQQMQQQIQKESKQQQQAQSMASFPPPHPLEQCRLSGAAQQIVSRQLECSQCISEIRQFGQFNGGPPLQNRP